MPAALPTDGMDALAVGTPALLLADMPVALAAKDIDGVYRFANPAFHRAFGLEGKAIAGRRDADLYPARVAEEFTHQDRDVATHGEARSFEQNVDVGGRKRRFLWHRFPVRDAGKVVGIGIALVDISERMRIESEVRAACAAAENAAGDLRRALAEAERRATIDLVSGALTRRRLDEILTHEMASTRRKGAMPSLLLFEIDRIADFVARAGIDAVDALEAELLRVVRSSLAPTHDIGRIWGGMFGVLLRETRPAEANLLARALAGRVAGCDLPHIGRAVLRVGVGEYAAGETLAQWLQRAEGSLRQTGATAPSTAASAAREPEPQSKQGPAPAPKPGRKPRLDWGEQTLAQSAAKRSPEQPVLLAWHQTYESGNAAIDAEHKHLFESCNALLNAMNEGRPVRQTVGLARALVDEIASHFANEEAILTEQGYPGVRDHARAHALLLEKAATMSERVSSGTATSSEMFQFLVYDVVAHHLIGTDRRYFKHLRGLAGNR